MEKTIGAVLTQVQDRLKVPKWQENKFGGYKYRNLEDINLALKAPLKEAGAWYYLTDSIEVVGDRYYVVATVTFGADGVEETISSKAYAREAQDKKGMDVAQVTGASSSYARKYALCGLFAIDSGEDPDKIDTRETGKRTTKKPATESGLISEEQYKELLNLIKAVGMTEEQTKKIYKVSSLMVLPVASFERFKASALKHIGEKKAEKNEVGD